MKESWKKYIYAKFVDIKKKIYRFFHIPLYTKEQYETYQKVQIGDIVFCRMNFDETTMLSVPEGHQSRPYLIIGKSEGYLVGYPGSHKKWDQTTMNRMLQVKKEGNPYYINKQGRRIKSSGDSYFNLSKLSFLPIENIGHISSKLNHHYMNELGKKHMIMSNSDTTVYKIDYPFDFHINMGEVVEVDDEFYYIYSKEKSTCYGYLVTRKQTPILIQFGGVRYYLDIDHRKQFNDDDTLQIFYLASEKEIERLKLSIEELKESRRVKEEKKVSYTTRFLVGMQFDAPFEDEIYIYLFTYKGRDYGVAKSLLEEYYPELIILKNIRFYTKLERIEKEELVSILEDLCEDLEQPQEINSILLQIYNKEKGKTYVENSNDHIDEYESTL